ncbi:MAG: gamma-glutamylcyclotransferase [Alphaproteobacteria bacterium]
MGEGDKPAEAPADQKIDEIATAILRGRGEGLPIRPQSDGNVRRNDFDPKFIEAMRRAARERGEDPWLSEEELDRTHAKMMSEHPKGEDLWFFGYGSLMWNPALNIADSKFANVRGFHRAFCLSLRMGRGSPEFPGLMLALMPGGACNGVAMCIAGTEVATETRILWTREMLSGAYRPVWLDTQIGDKRVKSLSFAANPKHNRYVGKSSFEETAQLIAKAQGVFGKNRDYLYSTVKALETHGVTSGPMHKLAKRVREIADEGET